MSSIAQWLDELGLARYASAFEGDDIDVELLAELSDDDLKEIGVPSLGHRRRIMAAIGGRSTDRSEAVDAPDSGAAPAPAADTERRQITVMFFDLVGSTALSGETPDLVDAKALLDVLA